MSNRTRSSIPTFAVAGISLLIAVVTGVQWLGQPLRMVNLLTIIGMSVTAGVLWMQAVWSVREKRSASHGDSVH